MNEQDSKKSTINITQIVLALLICATLIGCTVLFSRGNFYIKNLGSSTLQNDKVLNTISVTGDGKVFAKPDMADMSFSISESAPTSKQALENANKKMNEVIARVSKHGVDKKDIQTSQLNVYPEYSYSNNGQVPKIIAQRATVSIHVTARGVDEKGQKAAEIIDDVAGVDNVQVGSISFDIEDKAPYFKQARELAYKKAQQKATELAGLGKIKLLNPVSITDAAVDISPAPLLNYAVADSKVAGSAPESNAQVQTGQLELSINLQVIFGTE